MQNKHANHFMLNLGVTEGDDSECSRQCFVEVGLYKNISLAKQHEVLCGQYVVQSINKEIQIQNHS